jgi:hypothetical protein
MYLCSVTGQAIANRDLGSSFKRTDKKTSHRQVGMTRPFCSYEELCHIVPIRTADSSTSVSIEKLNPLIERFSSNVAPLSTPSTVIQPYLQPPMELPPRSPSKPVTDVSAPNRTSSVCYWGLRISFHASSRVLTSQLCRSSAAGTSTSASPWEILLIQFSHG